MIYIKLYKNGLITYTKRRPTGYNSYIWSEITINKANLDALKDLVYIIQQQWVKNGVKKMK